MVKSISKNTRNELVEAIRQRYLKEKKSEKTKILDEFIALSGYHPKHAARLLRRNNLLDEPKKLNGQQIFDLAVKETLIILWETADRICSKRLKAVIPDLIEAM